MDVLRKDVSCHKTPALCLKSTKPVSLKHQSDVTFAHPDEPLQRDKRTSTSAFVFSKPQVSTFEGEPRGFPWIGAHGETTTDSHPNRPNIINVSAVNHLELYLLEQQTDVLTFMSLKGSKEDKGECDSFAITVTSATSTPDSVRPETSLANLCSMMAVQDPVPHNIEKGCLPQTSCLNQTEEDQAIENNLSGYVPQVLVQEQAVVAPQDWAEPNNLKRGAFCKVASSVPTQDGCEQCVAAPAADKDEWDASTEAGEENVRRRT